MGFIENNIDSENLTNVDKIISVDYFADIASEYNKDIEVLNIMNVSDPTNVKSMKESIYYFRE
jgi:hypothetical protein